ncbi:aldehyde ferredoxin oxidoreductase family protein [Desulfobacterales bacterium HSG16]|nr:aldehyde ferredoxin oxidoreductase family protein [Desulfobacterales bacterium HSG16]
MKPNGCMNRILLVDLSRSVSRPVSVPQKLQEDFVGGKGFGAKLLYDLVPQGADPLGPDNVLMFFTGPLTATPAPSMRACVVTKSPLTGLFLDAYFGGRFGPEIKYAGYDGLIITGRAENPVIVSIRDDNIEFIPADDVWGMDALSANAKVKQKLGAEDARVATIGQAGENLVRFSLICCEPNRQAGRGGAGAVMGSKNLKAIAVQGSQLVRVNDPEAFEAACGQALEEIAQSEACEALTQSGTSYAVPWSNAVGTLPVRNHYYSDYDKADRLGDIGQAKHLFLGKAACQGCPIRCSQMGAIRTGKYAHRITDIVEYESAALMGSNLEIDDVRAVAHLVKLCDAYGLDSMSTGGVLAFAFEVIEKGLIIPPPPDLPLKFGSPEGAEWLIRSIALNENEMGSLLGQGVKRASEKIGQGSDAFALHVKGMEIPGFSPRGTPGMGLAYMTADRGACHQRGFMVGFEVGGELYNGKPVDNYGLDQKAEILIEQQNYLSGLDILVKCDFGAFGITAQCYAQLFTAATGREVDASFFNNIGERIWNQIRLFNLREGMDIKDERLPRRFVEEPLTRGPHEGRCISESDMAFMLTDYYRLRGWSPKGRPSNEKQKELGLDPQPQYRFNKEI